MRIRVAIADHNRSSIDALNHQLSWSSFATDLSQLTQWLVAKKLLTPTERKQALALRSTIQNPSLYIS